MTNNRGLQAANVALLFLMWINFTEASEPQHLGNASHAESVERSLSRFNDLHKRTSIISSLDLGVALEASDSVRDELLRSGLIPASLVNQSGATKFGGLLGAAIEKYFPDIAEAFGIEPRTEYRIFYELFANGGKFDFNRREDSERFGTRENIDALGNVAYTFALRDNIGFRDELFGARASTWLAGGVELLDDQRKNIIREIKSIEPYFRYTLDFGVRQIDPFGTRIFWLNTEVDYGIGFPQPSPGLDYYSDLILKPNVVFERAFENDTRDYLFLEEAAKFHEFYRIDEAFRAIFGESVDIDRLMQPRAPLMTPYDQSDHNWRFFEHQADTPYDSLLGIDYGFGLGGGISPPYLADTH